MGGFDANDITELIPSEGPMNRESVGICRWRIASSILAALTIVSVVPAVALSHGGGLDAYGCHRNRKAGGYHCHRGEFSGRSFSRKEDMLDLMQSRKTPQSKPATIPLLKAQKVNYKVEVIKRDDVDGTIKKRRHTILITPMPDSEEDIKRVVAEYMRKLRAAGPANISVSAVRSRKDNPDKWYGQGIWIAHDPEPQIMVQLEAWPDD